MRLATRFSEVLIVLLATGMFVSESQADVSARLTRGTLTLTGDSFGDLVEINGTRGGTTIPNLIVVSINGGPFVEYAGVANVRMDMRAGADEVKVAFIDILGDFDVIMGGDIGDRCLVGFCGIGGNYTSQGYSETAALYLGVGGNMTLRADMALDVDGDGFTTFVGGIRVVGQARIDGGRSSDDDIFVDECEFDRDLSVNLGGGVDDATLDSNIIGRNLTTDGGAGFDILNRARNLIGGRNSSRRFEIMTDVG